MVPLQKKARTNFATTVETMESTNVDGVNVTFRGLNGEHIGTVSVEASALGRDLVVLARTLRGHGAVTLFHGDATVQEDLPVGVQHLHGAELQLVL